MKTQTITPIIHENKIIENENEFFDKLIHSLKVDRDCLDKKILNTNTTKTYQNLIAENETDFIEILEKHTLKKEKSELAKIILNFLDLLSKKEVQLFKLGFDLSDSNILIWAILPNDNELNESNFISAVAKANAENESKFYLDAVWVEEEDNLEMPNNFKSIID
ncbi:MAG TPA: hypothetical protein DIS94_07860 [Bacteroidetes bacterium]|nr:hypothetical protein [Bacteroidota bacterium]